MAVCPWIFPGLAAPPSSGVLDASSPGADEGASSPSWGDEQDLVLTHAHQITLRWHNLVNTTIPFTVSFASDL